VAQSRPENPDIGTDKRPGFKVWWNPGLMP